jgi:hypothetical protein
MLFLPSIAMAQQAEISKVSPGVVLQNTGAQFSKVSPGVVIQYKGVWVTKVSVGIVLQTAPATTPWAVTVRAPLTHW